MNDLIFFLLCFSGSTEMESKPWCQRNKYPNTIGESKQKLKNTKKLLQNEVIAQRMLKSAKEEATKKAQSKTDIAKNAPSEKV